VPKPPPVRFAKCSRVRHTYQVRNIGTERTKKQNEPSTAAYPAEKFFRCIVLSVRLLAKPEAEGTGSRLPRSTPQEHAVSLPRGGLRHNRFSPREMARVTQNLPRFLTLLQPLGGTFHLASCSGLGARGAQKVPKNNALLSKDGLGKPSEANKANLRHLGSQTNRLRFWADRGISVVLRRALAFTLLFVALAGVFPVQASARVEKHAALIIDVNSGAVLHKDDADELRHPASLTKMMTLYLTFETLESGRLKMSDMITISQNAASVAPSKLDLKPGEQISVRNAIGAIVTKSANDIAVALAEKIGGTEANFVRLMNVRARQIGMTKTHFENPSGLPNDDHVTTARDMATLALHLMDDYPTYFPVFETRTFTYEGKSYRNHNTMLNTYAGVDGIKTGYTRASGFNLVTSVHRGRRHLLGVVFGGRTAASRNAEMRVLLTKAFIRASTTKTRKPMLLAKGGSSRKIADRSQSRPAQQVAEAGQAERQETPIHVFKVRPVPIVTKNSTAPADQTTDMEDTDGPDTSVAAQTSKPNNSDAGFLAAAERLGQRAEMLGASDRIPDSMHTGAVARQPVAFAPARDPAADVPPVQMRPRFQAPPQARAVIAERQPIQTSETRQLGLPPSTLNAQASALDARLNRAPVQAQYRQARQQQDRVTTVRASAGNYEVQIGAYGSIAEAQRALSSVQDKASRLLAGSASVTHPVTKNGHQFFRARFAGFDADRAASTCTALRSKGVDCFVMAGD
jgi:D-alanyl-D-alanine carboxypeptidase